MVSKPRTNDPWNLSQLFTLRVWYEESGTSNKEIRIQVRHVLSGETHYVHSWGTLIAYVLAKLDGALPTREG